MRNINGESFRDVTWELGFKTWMGMAGTKTVGASPWVI